jgi:hypothetical protein
LKHSRKSRSHKCLIRKVLSPPEKTNLISISLE